MWRWKVNLIFRWPGELQDLLEIFSLDSRQSNTGSSNQNLKETLGKNKLELSKLLEELDSLCFF